MKKKLVAGILMAALSVSCLTGCEGFTSEVNDLNGSITGNTYNASFYTNVFRRKLGLYEKIVQRSYGYNRW